MYNISLMIFNDVIKSLIINTILKYNNTINIMITMFQETLSGRRDTASETGNFNEWPTLLLPKV